MILGTWEFQRHVQLIFQILFLQLPSQVSKGGEEPWVIEFKETEYWNH